MCTFMHRDDARTMSFSWIKVAAEKIDFCYHPLSPCSRWPDAGRVSTDCRDVENAAMKPSAPNKIGLAPRSWKWRVALIYVTLLAASHIVTWARSTDKGGAGSAVTVQAIDGEQQVNREVRIAYQEYGSSGDPAGPTAILVHGSPGHKDDFLSLAPELAKRYRVVAPDLPGFGSSTADIPDYSI